MNRQSREGSVQSEIGLMLPTTDGEKHMKGPVAFSSRSKHLVFTETDGVCAPPKEMFSSRM